MTDRCKSFYRAQPRREYTAIGTPEVGDELQLRTNNGGKVLVCPKKTIIACLAEGDRVQIGGFRHRFRRAWKIGGRQHIQATLGRDDKGREGFSWDETFIPLQQMSRRLTFRVISVVNRNNHEPEYDEKVVARLVSLVEPTTAYVVV